MTQNTSHAVMAQRIEPNDSLDFFPTPPWATRALCAHVAPIAGHLAWDPACGEGAMESPLCDYALAVAMSDVHDYGKGYRVHDFLMPFMPDGIGCAEWIVTNPPFRLGEQFIRRGLEIATHGVAMLVRTSFVESVGRYNNLFKETPPAIVAQFCERVPMVKGRLDRKASTATSYCWLVWSRLRKHQHTVFQWIPPCRAQLERDSDYPILERVAA
jgi:hypothetical protein